MNVPAVWKVKREFARLGRQILRAHRYFITYMFARPYYDLILSRKIQEFRGQMPLTEKIAVYLIFPNAGLLQSHIAAIKYLGASGYAPLVVSNATLEEADRRTIRECSYLLLERPNFGYDFGGYRDAILLIGRKRLAKLDRLVLLNDSSWFPLPRGMDWLNEAEALGVDYAAAAWHGAVSPCDPETYELVDWSIRKQRRNFHYASFALSISGAILRANGFWRFWARFRLTNEKHRTVRRGEIGLTRWVMRHGFSHGATTELENLAEDLRAMDASELDLIFSRLALVADPKAKRRWRAIIGKNAPPLTRAQKEKVILALTSREGMVYALADYLVRSRRFGFLKKSPLREGEPAASIFLSTIRSLGGPTGELILDEARMLASPAASNVPPKPSERRHAW